MRGVAAATRERGNKQRDDDDDDDDNSNNNSGVITKAAWHFQTSARVAIYTLRPGEHCECPLRPNTHARRRRRRKRISEALNQIAIEPLNQSDKSTHADAFRSSTWSSPWRPYWDRPEKPRVSEEVDCAMYIHLFAVRLTQSDHEVERLKDRLHQSHSTVN